MPETDYHRNRKQTSREVLHNRITLDNVRDSISSVDSVEVPEFITDIKEEEIKPYSSKVVGLAFSAEEKGSAER
ncbi:hypothetical protein CHS0354_040948 [Potamilus streckersoni]|uniref:Uncharacterized protein n=1 Tax=Potamilus streckersoni TaxID=2493646 RepID=A0AAE0T8M5_9BIVA|nr:hypothetical protein CHS0354_040948 [Potamilus streckersoni]